MSCRVAVAAAWLAAFLIVLGGPAAAQDGPSRQPGSQPAPVDAGGLEAGFRQPPDSAKPHTWWHWMEGYVTREGITADLEAMKRVGIGGATIFNVGGAGDAKSTGLKPVTFMSPEWRAMVKHAAEEAGRLGLELGMHNCAGWSSSGGPWITPELSMQRVVATETAVKGPRKFEEVLAQPKAEYGFYRDVAVMAVRSAGAAPVPREGVVDLTARMGADGKLSWDAPEGEWVVLRIGHTSCGGGQMMAVTGGKGLECDKLSREAVDAHWAGIIRKILDDLGPLGGKVFNNVEVDSYEVGPQNWTPKFREEFRKRRGYDPLPWLPVVLGRTVESKEVSQRVRWDWERTVADLFADNYYGYFAELCHQHGMIFSCEPYGGPFESLQCGGRSDLPMGEFWLGQRETGRCWMAARAGHIYGRRVIGAEAFTAGHETFHWGKDPQAFKARGDEIFCVGVNRLIFHRYAHQPWLDRKPGMTMGFNGSNIERTNTWWEPGAAWMKYLGRCQYLLQQGLYVADTCWFSGEGGGAGGPEDTSDAINAEVILTRLAVKDGRLVLPDGMSYQALVLSGRGVLTMTPRLLRRLKELVEAGATVIGPRPTASPSLENYPQCDAEVQALAAELWGDCDGQKVNEHKLGKGRVLWRSTLNLKPDFEVLPDQPGGKPAARLLFIHRRAEDADIYFVANAGGGGEAECAFRVDGKLPELWHPDTGRVEAAPLWREADGRTVVRLRFDPLESVFVVFRKKSGGADHAVGAKSSAPEAPSAFDLVVTPEGRTEVRAWAPGRFEVQTAAGRTLAAEAKQVPAPVEVGGPWEVRFPPKWGAPEAVTLEKLISWTEHPEPGVKYFSGTATYVKEFELPAALLGADRVVRLELGRVMNLAEVRLNDQDLGVLWKAPFEVDVTGAARSGKNRIEVRITNLWANRLIGDAALPVEKRVTYATFCPYKPDSPLLESGLFGPVRLRAAVRLEPR